MLASIIITDPVIIPIIAIAVFLMMIGTFVFIAVSMYKDRKEGEKRLESSSSDEPPLDEVDATVVSMRCHAGLTGSHRSPQSIKEFFVTFRTKDGNEIEFKVEENIYLSLSEGLNGSLATVNGNFYGFYFEEE